MDHQTEKCHKSYEISMMGTVCKPSCNGLRCPNCEMQNGNDCSVEYIQIQPKTNENHFRKQVAKRINMTPINNLAMRRVRLHRLFDELDLQHEQRKFHGMCGINCNQKHNLMSSMRLLPLQFCSRVNDTVHWPRQNYKKDGIATVQGYKCGCGKVWRKDHVLQDSKHL